MRSHRFGCPASGSLRSSGHSASMFDHTGIVVPDFARARRFYDALAGVRKVQTADNSPESFLLGRSAEDAIPYLWNVTMRPSYWSEGSRPGINQGDIAFVATSKAMVDEFYRAALDAGGRDNGAPGP